MTSRNVETRVVRLEARSRLGQMSRLSRDEIVARIGEIYRGLIDRHGGAWRRRVSPRSDRPCRRPAPQCLSPSRRVAAMTVRAIELRLRKIEQTYTDNPYERMSEEQLDAEIEMLLSEVCEGFPSVNAAAEAFKASTDPLDREVAERLVHRLCHRGAHSRSDAVVCSK
jgi:hypothetical protein